MREISILCTGEEVRDILAGKQEKYRRPITPQPPDGRYQLVTLLEDTGSPKNNGKHHWAIVKDLEIVEDQGILFKAPWQPGDLLYVREDVRPSEVIPSDLMPKSIARIWLKVKSIRAERRDGIRCWVTEFLETEK